LLIGLNVREYRRINQKWTIQRNWQHMVHKTRRRKTKQKHNTICVGHHYTQTNTNNMNKTLALLQITGGKDETKLLSNNDRQQHIPLFDQTTNIQKQK